jgi:hypothetical protein
MGHHLPSTSTFNQTGTIPANRKKKRFRLVL